MTSQFPESPSRSASLPQTPGYEATQVPAPAGKSPYYRYEPVSAEDDDGEDIDSDEELGTETLFVTPDLGKYLDYFELTPQQKIALARTFANYLSAQLPKPTSKIASQKKRKISKK